MKLNDAIIEAHHIQPNPYKSKHNQMKIGQTYWLGTKPH